MVCPASRLALSLPPPPRDRGNSSCSLMAMAWSMKRESLVVVVWMVGGRLFAGRVRGDGDGGATSDLRVEWDRRNGAAT